MKKIIAISGSLRVGSSNHAILQFLAKQAPDYLAYEIYNELAQIPPFDPGLDHEDAPVSVSGLRKLLSEADGIIICTPEYAFGVPGQLKNMLDWLVSSSTLVDKPIALITASLGGEHAHDSLLLTLGALSANVIPDASLIISFIRSKVDQQGNITDGDTMKKLQQAFNTLLTVI